MNKTLPERFPLLARVELRPHTDLWRQGARFGTIVGTDSPMNKVLVEIAGHRVWFNHDDLWSPVEPKDI